MTWHAPFPAMVERRALLACLAVAALLLAGCSGKKGGKETDTDGDGVPDVEDATPDGGTLPDGLTYTPGYVGPDGGYVEGDQVSFFCQSFANSTVAIDQNRTFSGNAHSHDMWSGEDSKVIFEGDVATFDQGSWFVMPGAVVFPGAGRTELMLDFEPTYPGEGRQLGVDYIKGEGHGGPDIWLNFTEPGQVHAFDFNFTVNDRPHAEKSGWGFRMLSYNANAQGIAGPNDPAGQQTVEREANNALGDLPAFVKWTIFRVYDCLPVDPPHYDYWQGLTERLVFEERMTHDYQHTGGVGATQGPFRGFQGTGLRGLPDNGTIPPGTATVVVQMTWDGDEASVTPLGLEYVAADQDAVSTSAVWIRPPVSSASGSTREWVISVHPLETDSPYAEKSRWDFRWFLDYPVDDDPSGQGTGRFKGTVDWKVTAYRDGFGPA
jgi:hypothetical protein